MSTTPPMMDPHWLPPEPPRSGCGKKLVISLGCGCFLMLLCCCGGILSLVGWVWTSGTDEPTAIQAAATEIAQLDIPADLKPKGALRLKVPFGTQTLLLGSVYEDAGTKSVLMLGTGVFLTDDVAKAVQEALQKETPNEQRQPLLNSRSEQKAVSIKGKPTPFTFTTGQDARTKQARLEVRGLFAGKSGSALFMFVGSAEKYPAAKLQALLESIR